MNKLINNTSNILLKKILGKNRIVKIKLIEDGFIVFREKRERTLLYFKDIMIMRTGYYFYENMPYHIITILMNDREKYSMDVSSKKEGIDTILKHYAKYQLRGDIPEDIDDINVLLQHGLNDYSIRLASGNLIKTGHGQKVLYPLNAIEYYRIDKESDAIDIKIRNKEEFITLNVAYVTNIWLVLQILERFIKQPESLLTT
ncbi:MAG: hypothetical protein ACTTIR_04615 [Eggerthia catenaformis]|uniref:hypothetical protein n=1 Tax=Eggerthia catenaformis TaxID=31973 RepID=UPI003C703DB0